MKLEVIEDSDGNSVKAFSKLAFFFQLETKMYKIRIMNIKG